MVKCLLRSPVYQTAITAPFGVALIHLVRFNTVAARPLVFANTTRREQNAAVKASVHSSGARRRISLPRADNSASPARRPRQRRYSPEHRGGVVVAPFWPRKADRALTTKSLTPPCMSPENFGVFVGRTSSPACRRQRISSPPALFFLGRSASVPESSITSLTTGQHASHTAPRVSCIRRAPSTPLSMGLLLPVE